MFPCPFSARPDPYINNGELAYVYHKGIFRQVRSDHHTGGGAFQFRFVLDGSVGCSGFGQPYLLSVEDMRWFQETIKMYGSDYLALIKRQERDDRLNYLLLWLDATDRCTRLQFKEGIRKDPEDWFDSWNFLWKLAAVSLP